MNDWNRIIDLIFSELDYQKIKFHGFQKINEEEIRFVFKRKETNLCYTIDISKSMQESQVVQIIRHEILVFSINHQEEYLPMVNKT